MLRIRELRLSRTISQAKLALRLEVPPCVLSEIELGKRRPWKRLGERLEDFFGTSLSELLQEVPEGETAPTATSFMKTAI